MFIRIRNEKDLPVEKRHGSNNNKNARRQQRRKALSIFDGPNEQNRKTGNAVWQKRSSSKSNVCQPPAGGKPHFKIRIIDSERVIIIINGEWVKEPSALANLESVFYSERLVTPLIPVLASSSVLGFCYEPCAP